MTYQKDYSSREKTTSKADLQCTHKAINGLSSSNGEMLEILSEKAGFISRKSFDEACQALAQSSSHTRSSDMSLDTHEYGEHHYLKITRPLSTNSYPPTQSDSTKLYSAAQDPQDIHEFSNIEEEEEEDAAIYHFSPSHTVSSVEYHILHSPSYRVPVLYFFLRNLPPSIAQSIDTVYEHLIPKHLQSGARNVSVMGGIGMTHHPLTDVPCFWVHPCNSAEAMRKILGGMKGEVSPVEYLMLWIGLVGIAVGLSLPKEIVRQVVS